MYKDLSLRIFNIRRIKFLSKTDVKESIEKSMPLDGNPKRALLTMIPKMLFIKYNDTLTIKRIPRRNSEEIDIEKEFDIETLDLNFKVNAIEQNELFPGDVLLIILNDNCCFFVLFSRQEMLKDFPALD